MKQEEAEELTRMFKALSHPARREILDLLNNGPMTTNEVTEQTLTHEELVAADFEPGSVRQF